MNNERRRLHGRRLFYLTLSFIICHLLIVYASPERRSGVNS
jgi:hypothetical protein